MAQSPATYTSGHHASVLRSHTWRTAANSAPYLVPLLRPNMHVLDVGCGPGTITADFSTLVPSGSVVGIDMSEEVLENARAEAIKRGIGNIKFEAEDIEKLRYSDNTFDVAHAHQVLQHVGNPVQALREMQRVVRPDGIVACRDADFGAMTWFPDVPGLSDFIALYQKVARHNGGEPDAGRRIHAWAREAGLKTEKITKTAGTWCFSTKEEVGWWSGMWAERIIKSDFSKQAMGAGLADEEELRRFSEVWKDWGQREDAWFVLVHGEIICRV
ncbi:hypothetical protein MMC30_008102 [Trapelia coarctata]|nr:hypothetical protein [Trapelia coarctata]